MDVFSTAKALINTGNAKNRKIPVIMKKNHSPNPGYVILFLIYSYKIPFNRKEKR